MKFVNRHTERKVLGNLIGKGSAMLFGRRRVGKTALIKNCLTNTPNVFYQAVKLPAPLIYKELSMLIGEASNNPVLKSGDIKDISIILNIFAEQCKGWTLVLDEFGYMVESDPALPSIIQRFLDNKRDAVGLFLTGSTYSIIQSLLGEKSPLWGRIDNSMEILPLSFIYTADFWEELPFDYRAGLYGALGGIPYNWERAVIKDEFFDTLAHSFFLPASPLYQEVYYILREELREPKVYMAVLQAMASGRRRFSEISDASGIPVSNLSKYLEVLKGLNLITQEVPVNEKLTGGKGLWRIKDPMIRFWFKYVLPYRHMIEVEAGEKVTPILKKTWDDYMGEIYEDIAMQLTIELIKRGELPFVEKLGRWWNKDIEFDIVGMNQKKICLLGEVKWGYFSNEDLGKFEQKVKRVPFELDKDIKYIIFAGKGFKVDVPSGITAISGERLFKLSASGGSEPF
ncbi:MAG: ATP-binding protein [Candidatus Omnitrophota bacterium]